MQWSGEDQNVERLEWHECYGGCLGVPGDFSRRFFSRQRLCIIVVSMTRVFTPLPRRLPPPSAVVGRGGAVLGIATACTPPPSSNRLPRIHCPKYAQVPFRSAKTNRLRLTNFRSAHRLYRASGIVLHDTHPVHPAPLMRCCCAAQVAESAVGRSLPLPHPPAPSSTHPRAAHVEVIDGFVSV
jgi:hypothetical protein